MAIYLVILFHFLLYVIFSRWSDKQKKKPFFFFTTIFMFVILGLRSFNVGIDTISYTRYFEMYKPYSIKELIFGIQWFKKFEPLIIVLFKIIQNWSDDSQVMVCVIGILYVFLFVLLLLRLDDYERYEYAYLFYGMYIVCSGMNIMRQAFAVITFAHAVLFFRKDKRIQALIVSVVAYGFHRAIILPAVVMWIYMFLGRSGLRAKLIKWGSIVGCIGGIFLYQYIFTALGIAGYIDSEGADVGIYTLILLAIIVLLSYFNNQENEIESYNNVKAFYETSMIIAITCCIFAGFIAIFMRFTSLMIPILIFPCLSKTKKSIKESARKSMSYLKILRVALFGFIILFFIHNLNANIGGIVPYEFYWNY